MFWENGNVDCGDEEEGWCYGRIKNGESDAVGKEDEWDCGDGRRDCAVGSGVWVIMLRIVTILQDDYTNLRRKHIAKTCEKTLRK